MKLAAAYVLTHLRAVGIDASSDFYWQGRRRLDCAAANALSDHLQLYIDAKVGEDAK
jgi:hypothetical protein